MAKVRLNEHGQPPWQINASRNARRSVDEFLGLCKGLMADGHLGLEEFNFLLSWLRNHSLIHDVWPVCVLIRRIEAVLERDEIDASELSDLEDVLTKIAGGEPVFGYQGRTSSGLPFDDPLPSIEFDGRLFCLTGRFITGTRKTCERAIIDRGGLVKSAVTTNTDYVVVGSIASSDWIHSTHGTKILKAIEYRNRGMPISIVPEHHWAAYLDK